ncbi:MAG: glutamate racemase [Rikenellaceae bacterium]
MRKNQIIGLFDSGIGGLTLLRELVKILPKENYIYYGDGKNCPLGNKSSQEVLKVTDNAINHLVANGAKMVVIACNTASAIAKERLRAKYDIDIIAIEPAVKPALAATKSGIVGVLATRNTINSSPLKSLCELWQEDKKVILRPGDGLVEMVEKSTPLTAEDREVITSHIEALIAKGADKIVLGCTHYPFLRDEMQQIIANRQIEIIDPAPYVAIRAKDILEKKGLLNTQSQNGKIIFTSSLNEEYNKTIEQKFLLLNSKA